jgi:DDE superfamily endonuclease
MATPFPATTGGTKDAYNFYHSQLRINIECAFGRLVARWSILRTAIPMNVTIAKTTALVLCLAKLHNFCINEADAEAINTTRDSTHIMVVGGVELIDSPAASTPLPISLMGGGEHSDDLTENDLRRLRREYENVVLPRALLHGLIETKGLTRPLPMRERH